MSTQRTPSGTAAVQAVDAHALIIGGASGIGLATAKKLALRRAGIWLVGRSRDKLTHAPQCLKSGGRVRLTQADVTDQRDVERLLGQIDGESTPLTYLVNAAGVFEPKAFLEHTVSDYDNYLALNRGMFQITQAAARSMIRGGGGAIVNVGSMWANQAVKSTPSSAYAMAKAGVHAMTQHLAMELADYNIRVNAVAPAVVDTPIYEAFVPSDDRESTMRGFDAFHPIGRVGTAEDVAHAVLFLLSDESTWMTGEVMNVDGGVMAGRN